MPKEKDERSPLIEAAQPKQDSIEAIIDQVSDEISTGSLGLQKKDKIAAIASCLICGYGVLLFLGPNYYTNEDDTEFMRIWYTAWSLIFNFVLNSYFSVKPLQESYDKINRINVNKNTTIPS